MKTSNIFLIILTSIVTFIGLCINKLYDRFIKKNIIVQGAIYTIFTIGSLRLLYWIAKPIIPTGVPRMLQGLDKVTIVIPEVTPLISLIVFIAAIIVLGGCIRALLYESEK